MRWKEHFFEDENDNEGTEEPALPNIFKVTKSNLPHEKPPAALADYLGAVKSDLVASCASQSCRQNLTNGESQALRELKSAQDEGHITIKRADKGGGICVMDTEDYINEMQGQLTAKSNTGGQFYVPASEKELKIQAKRISELLEVGHKNGFISDSDFKAMKPSEKPGKLYGLPKCHKPKKR